MATPGQVAADLLGLTIETAAKVHLSVVKHGAMLQAATKRNAALPRTGPPGPRIITGDYNRSINRRTTKSATGSAVSVGTNAPQGRRLEFGFTGTDALGRNYNQPPYPHFGPALDSISPLFIADMARLGLPHSRGGTNDPGT